MSVRNATPGLLILGTIHCSSLRTILNGKLFFFKEKRKRTMNRVKEGEPAIE